jgi:hypothetical protein
MGLVYTLEESGSHAALPFRHHPLFPAWFRSLPVAPIETTAQMTATLAVARSTVAA